MRVVLDTNTVISGLLWEGSPARVLDLAFAHLVEIATSEVLLDELSDVLSRKKFDRRFEQTGRNRTELLSRYAIMAKIVSPVSLPRTVPNDPDDDAVLACAVTAEAAAIVTGDPHLLTLRDYRGISILTPTAFLQWYAIESQ